MLAVFGLLIIILVSIIAVRIGAIALELTGLSPEIASFQAQSAFSGAGFTTSESETLVNHPVRRKIIRILILFGSAGIATSMATLVLTFLGATGHDMLLKGAFLLTGLIFLYIFARSRHVYVLMKRLISGLLRKWTKVHIFDYEQLLGFNEGYMISRIKVKPDSWVSNKKISELKLEQKGVLILAIYRRINKKEKFIGIVTGDTLIEANDVLIYYSHQDVSGFLLEGKEEPA